jgi:deoxyribose-phosphate aldolase
VSDARGYLQLAADALGVSALTAQRMRFGASGLLGDIEAVLAGQDSAAVSAAY